jgi:hypothetical protein
MATDKMDMSLDALIKAQRADRPKSAGKGKKGKPGQTSANGSAAANGQDALVAAAGARSKAQRGNKFAKVRGMDIDSVPVLVVPPRTRPDYNGQGGLIVGGLMPPKQKKKKALGSARKAKLPSPKAQAGTGAAGQMHSPRNVKITIPGPAASGGNGSQPQPAAGDSKKKKKGARAKGGSGAAGAVKSTGRGIGKKNTKGGKPGSLAQAMAMTAILGSGTGAISGAAKGGRGRKGVKGRQGGAKGTQTKGKSAAQAKKKGGGLSARFSS